MTVWELIFIAIGLSMDAVAVSLTNGMSEPRMRTGKAMGIAGSFGFFQGVMPLIGYFCGTVFAYWVGLIAPWLSFVLLGFIGGKMIFDFICERIAKGKEAERAHSQPGQSSLSVGKLLVQALATSIDALAVGVTLVAAQQSGGLPFHAAWCALLIASVTFCLSLAAVYVGKKAGDGLADKAGLAGGIILVAIGIKILIEGLAG